MTQVPAATSTTAPKLIAAPIPTNIITGFLGVGKTSAILKLLADKPAGERWAVLVNEFGEIGVDGSLLEGRHTDASGVFIREVPGGCMCCAAGLSMQIALNQLISRAKPDRILIEPTGLGHPLEVLEILSGPYYQEVVSLQKIIALVDPRKLKLSRYTEHETFQQQVAIADVVVGNKCDLYDGDDAERLTQYVQQQCAPHTPVIFTEQGALEVAVLEGATRSFIETDSHHSELLLGDLEEDPIPEAGFLKASNQGEGFESVGWRFSPDRVFDRSKLFSFLCGLEVERMKAVFITEDGIFGYNQTEDALTEMALDDCFESRIEIISAQTQDRWEIDLMSCEAHRD